VQVRGYPVTVSGKFPVLQPLTGRVGKAAGKNRGLIKRGFDGMKKRPEWGRCGGETPAEGGGPQQSAARGGDFPPLPQYHRTCVINHRFMRRKPGDFDGHARAWRG
jgi:hypothetical protein